MTDDPALERDFSPGFLRKVLALGVRAGLHRRVPGALLPAHFAGLGDGTRNASPRQRLAAVLERFWAEAPGEWPGAETMDVLVEREAGRLRADEAAALREEWAAVRAVPVTDPATVEREVRDWVARVGLQRALLQAADLYQSGAAPAEIAARLHRALREADPQPSAQVVSLVETYRERVLLWERGEEPGERVPTGLRALDLALGGGLRRREVFYALAPPKGAKTTFQVNVALNAARARFGVAYFSYEMGQTPMLLRMDRNVARASKQELREDPRRLERMYGGLVAAGAGDVMLWTGSPQQAGACDQVQSVVEDLRREGRAVDLVCLDFLNIMGASREEREKRHELARISREISQLAKALDVAVWSASLVRRAAIAKPKLRKDDIAESFEVIAVADGVVGICAPDELVLQGLRSLYLAALREEGDERHAGLYRVDLDRMTFSEVAAEPPPQEGDGA